MSAHPPLRALEIALCERMKGVQECSAHPPLRALERIALGERMKEAQE